MITLKDMDTKKAFEILKDALVAMQYMETVTQKTVNGNALVIADAVKQGDDVDGSEISKSWKTKHNTSKIAKACVKLLEVTEAHLHHEAKVKAIPAEAVRVVKPLALATSK